jgi:hypothetical protein
VPVKPADLLDSITGFYRRSRDFNGIPAGKLMAEHELSHEQLLAAVEPMILAGDVSAIFGTGVPNPHIRAVEDKPPEVQVGQLKDPRNQEYGINFYPTERTLRKVRAGRRFAHSPYSKLLALGRPQLSFVSFELSILEHYRNDPRYHYEVDDVSGWLGVRDEYYFKSETEFPEKHKVSIQSFGFSFDKALNRHVAVFLRYLHDLSPEHQNIWMAHQLMANCSFTPITSVPHISASSTKAFRSSTPFSKRLESSIEFARTSAGRQCSEQLSSLARDSSLS